LSPVDPTSIVNTAINNLPGIIALIRGNHRPAPGAPPLTDEEVTKALLLACDSSLAKDENWLAAHPSEVPGA
jgi:hypothetical protein